MKRMIALLLTGALSLRLVACGTGGTDSSGEDVSAGSRSETSANGQTESPADRKPNMSGMEEGGTSAPEEPQTAGSNVLIACFSVPEDIETTDAIAGASIVVRDGEKLGNTEYVAELIQQTIGGDLFRIETVEEYPLDHDPLVDQAAAAVPF